MGLLSSVSKFAQRVIVGDEASKKAKQHREPPAVRMIITEEPRPSHHEQVRTWINGGNELPDRAARINQRVHEMHHADYMSFPQGEGTLGVTRPKGIKSNPHDVDRFYIDSIATKRKSRRT